VPPLSVSPPKKIGVSDADAFKIVVFPEGAQFNDGPLLVVVADSVLVKGASPVSVRVPPFAVIVPPVAIRWAQAMFALAQLMLPLVCSNRLEIECPVPPVKTTVPL